MAKTKRTEFERKRDLTIITSLYLQKYSQAEIPKLLQSITGSEYLLCQQQISYDIAQIRNDFKKAREGELEENRNIKLAEIDNLKMLYFQAWRRSQDKSIVKFAEERTGPVEGKEGKSQTVSVKGAREEERIGDPRFMAGVQWCIQKEMEIQGITTPEATKPESKPFKLSVEIVSPKSKHKKRPR